MSNQLSRNEQDTIWRHFQTEGLAAFDLNNPRADFLVGLVPTEGQLRVLVIGTGSGYFDRQIAKLGHVVWSFDPVVEALASLQGSAVAGSIADLPFATSSLDLVVASEVIEHLDDETLSRGLSEVRRVLRQDGLFLGTTPFDEDLSDLEVICPCCNSRFHRWGHVQSFDENRLNAIFGAFEDVEIQPMLFVDRRASWRHKLLPVSRVARVALFGQKFSDQSLVFAASVTPGALTRVRARLKPRAVIAWASRRDKQ